MMIKSDCAAIINIRIMASTLCIMSFSIVRVLNLSI